MNAPASMEGIAAEAVAEIVREAGRAIRAIAQRGARVRRKADSTPVTDADEAADRLIVERLSTLAPDIPVIAEESHETRAGQGFEAPRFWLVDPLDGTREFIAGRDEYTVNVALIAAGRPVLGVVGAPARGVCFGGVEGVGAWREDAAGARRAIAARAAPDEGPVALASRSHRDRETDAWLAGAGVARTTRIGSSLKFCLVAEGAADVYPRFGRTMEWDTAAGHAVLAAAGGRVLTAGGAALSYGKPGFENPHFIARGRP